MHARKNSHRHVAWVVADEHLVDFEDRAELAIQSLGRNMRQIEIDLILAIDAIAVQADLEDFARGDVARHEVAVSRIFLFQKIPTLALWNRRRRTLITFLLRHPHAPAFAARRLRHQTQLVFARNRSWMDLYELAV